jgi:hypothetical protein
VIGNAHTDRLGRVEGACTACREHEIHLMLSCTFNQRTDQVYAGIGHHITVLYEMGMHGCGGGLHDVMDAEVEDVITAVYQQNRSGTVLFEQSFELPFGTDAEYQFTR